MGLKIIAWRSLWMTLRTYQISWKSTKRFKKLLVGAHRQTDWWSDKPTFILETKLIKKEGFKLLKAGTWQLCWPLSTILTNLLEFAWRVIAVQVVKKFPNFYKILKFITVFTRSRHRSLFWANRIHSIRQIIKHFMLRSRLRFTVCGRNFFHLGPHMWPQLQFSFLSVAAEQWVRSEGKNSGGWNSRCSDRHSRTGYSWTKPHAPSSWVCMRQVERWAGCLLQVTCQVYTSKAVPLHATKAFGWRGRAPTHSRSRPHAPAILLSRERTPVPIAQDAGWAPKPVWTQKLEEKILCLCRGSNLNRQVVLPVARHYTDWATRLKA
jgi:hypothetical protein